MAYTATNPYNGEVIQEFTDTTDKEIEDLLDKAESYYQKAKRVDFAKES